MVAPIESKPISPSASARSWDSSTRASRTRRSPGGCGSRWPPSRITSTISWRSSRCTAGAKRLRVSEPLCPGARSGRTPRAEPARVSPSSLLLLHGNAPRTNRRGRQCHRVEDQSKTPGRDRNREGHSRQRQGPVAHVYRGGAAEGGTPVRSDGPAADLTFYGDVLRRPEG